MTDPVADALQELRSITRCQCDAAWTDRGKHAVECVAYCREDVDLLAAEIERLNALDYAVKALIDIVDSIDNVSKNDPRRKYWKDERDRLFSTVRMAADR